jgi:hypothetical protein
MLSGTLPDVGNTLTADPQPVIGEWKPGAV